LIGLRADCNKKIEEEERNNVKMFNNFIKSCAKAVEQFFLMTEVSFSDSIDQLKVNILKYLFLVNI
jgi:hypothetical protein